jgi:hypothetical protein
MISGGSLRCFFHVLVADRDALGQRSQWRRSGRSIELRLSATSGDDQTEGFGVSNVQTYEAQGRWYDVLEAGVDTTSRLEEEDGGAVYSVSSLVNASSLNRRADLRLTRMVRE